MSQIDTSQQARMFLQGAGLGLQYRAQDIGQRQFQQGQQQQAQQFQQGHALSQQRFGLDQSMFDRQVALHEEEVAKDRITGRLWADKLRASLMPRGGIPIPGAGTVIFTPPGEDDDIHGMLDQVDNSDQAKLFADIVKSREARFRFRSEIASMEHGGYDAMLTPDSPTGHLFQMIKQSRDPETGLKELWQMRDRIYQEDVLNRQMQRMQDGTGGSMGGPILGGIDPVAAAVLGPKATAQEMIRNQREDKKSLVQSFEDGWKSLQSENRRLKGKDSDIADESKQALEAYQAAQNGLVTKDGWAVLNDGKPNSQGFIAFRHSSGKTYEIDPSVLANQGVPQGDAARGRAPGGMGGRGQQKPAAPRKVTKQDVVDIVARIGSKDPAKVRAEMKRLGLEE